MIIQLTLQTAMTDAIMITAIRTDDGQQLQRESNNGQPAPSILVNNGI